MFNKEEQRQRAAELSALNLAKGVKPVVLPPIQASKPASRSATPWPFPTRAPSSSASASSPNGLTPMLSPKKESIMSVKFSEEAFENEFGQVIEVGSKIIAVKQGYNHTISISQGIYLGLRRDHAGKVKNVIVKLKVRESGYFMPDGSVAKANVTNATYGVGIVEHRASLPRKRIYPTI